MKNIVRAIAVLSALFTLGLALLYQKTAAPAVLSLAVTFGTVAYHFWMRLLVGLAFEKIMHNRANLSARWYQPRKWEMRLYRTLRVKQWKNRMPTYDPSLFDLRRHSAAQIAQAMCQAELVHETIMVLSFVPLLLIIPFGAPVVFAATSAAAAALDGVFVVMQRYNRPRVLRLLEKDRHCAAPRTQST